MRASRLDRDLAHGASPDATVALALRAQMLVRTRARRDLARSAQRILAEATQDPADSPLRPPAAASLPAPAASRREAPAAPRVPAPATAARLRVPVCREQVRNSAEEFNGLIRRLLAGGPVAARGVALASILLSDGGGPLYHQASADDIRARVREAVNALDPPGI